MTRLTNSKEEATKIKDFIKKIIKEKNNGI